MNKLKLKFGISIALVLILVVCLYLYIGLQDEYFPYWDTYTNKHNIQNLEEFLGSSDTNSYNPSFYILIKSLMQITDLEYYSIAYWGNIVLIALLFLSISLFLRNSFKLDFKIRKHIYFLPVALILLFFAYYSKIRLSMFLRENIGFFVFFVFLAVLIKIRQEDKLKFKDWSFVMVFALFSIFIHPLMFLICSGVILFSFLLDFNIKLRKKIFFILFFILLSLPIILKVGLGIFNQLRSGSELIESQGFTLAYNLITFTYFNSIDLIILAIGILLFIGAYFNKGNHKLVSMSFIITITLGFFASYIEKFGSKQNRFALYVYLILSLFLMVLSGTYWKRFNKKVFAFIIFFIILTSSITFSSYNGYRPINSENLEFLEENVILIRNNSPALCGRSALVASKYLYENLCEDISQSTNLTNNTIVLFRDDLQFYRGYFQEIYYEIEQNMKSDRIIIKDKSGSIIIY